MRLRMAILAASSAALVCAAVPAFAQKAGGTLRISHRDNPPSASIHEESTISVNQPFMAVFNNLVFFDPNEKVNSPDKIVPELAESWSYNADQTKLTFKLRQGVKWHDGKPFTSADVKCTWDSLAGHVAEDKATHPQEPAQALVLQPQGSEDQRRLRGHLRARPAAALVPDDARRRLFAGLFLPRARPRDALQADRHRPVQGGRLQAQQIDQAGQATPTTGRRASPTSTRIDWKIVPNRSTRMLGFQSGEFDMTFDSDVTFPLLKDVKANKPDAVARRGRPTSAPTCWSTATSSRSTMPTIRKAMVLALDNKAFNDILSQGNDLERRRMLPPPAGVLGHAQDSCRPCPATRPTSRRAAPRRAS